MASLGVQQMILRRVDKQAPEAPDMARKVGEAGAVVLDQQPSSILVEGDTASIEAATKATEGWTAIPLRRYSIPDTKKQVR